MRRFVSTISRVDLRPFVLPTRRQIAREESPVIALVDGMFARLFQLGPGKVLAEMREGGSDDIVFTFYPKEGGPSVEVARCRRALFRRALSRLGGHYMDNQVLGGYMHRHLVLEGKHLTMLAYLSNTQLGGYWVKIFVGKAK